MSDPKANRWLEVTLKPRPEEPEAGPDGRIQLATGPRRVEPEDVPAVARLWWRGWQDAHAEILPAELARRRTLESFEARLRQGEGMARVVGPPDAPLGFYLLKGEELNQFYVAEEARGTGLAAELIADAEARLADNEVKRAWLACAIGNRRAARFYEKAGWELSGDVVIPLETLEGTFDLRIWRYEKGLSQRA